MCNWIRLCALFFHRNIVSKLLALLKIGSEEEEEQKVITKQLDRTPTNVCCQDPVTFCVVKASGLNDICIA